MKQQQNIVGWGIYVYLLGLGYIRVIIPNVNTIVQLKEDDITEYWVIKDLRDIDN